MRKLVLVSVLGLFLGGCAEMHRVMDFFKGEHEEVRCTEIPLNKAEYYKVCSDRKVTIDKIRY